MFTNNDFSYTLSGTAPNYTGYGSNLSDTGQVGINLNGANGYHIHDLTFHNFNGAAVSVQNSAGGWQHVGMFDNLAISNSYYGMRLFNVAEYETVSDCNVSNCTFGYLVESGNNTFSNCKATYCSIGVKINGGTNNGHGVWTGLLSNHCTYNLSCTNVSLGEHFNGCNFIAGQSGGYDAGGGIQIVNSQGITFAGGQIAFVDVNIDATSQVEMNGVTLRGTVNFTVASGGILVAKNNLVMPGAAITLNGVAWSGNN